MSRVRMSSVIVLVLLGLVAQPLLAATVSQNFDSDPASWVGSGNLDAPQNFGFSATNNAGGVLGAGTGEAGGHFVRETLGVYSTAVGSLDPSSDALSMTGRGRFTADGGGNVFLGWFDDTTPLDWQPDNFIGLRTDNTDVYLRAFANGDATSGETQLLGNLGIADSFSFTLDYDPEGNGGDGAITATINGGATVVHNLTANDRDGFTNLNRFGLFTLFNGGDNAVDAFWDDLTYTGASAGLPGDVNSDGFVDIFDINLVSANWGTPGGPTGDANGDGNVDIFDINLISANWAPMPGGAAAVPEPASAVLAALGVLGLVCAAGARSRRRVQQ